MTTALRILWFLFQVACIYYISSTLANALVKYIEMDVSNWRYSFIYGGIAFFFVDVKLIYWKLKEKGE